MNDKKVWVAILGVLAILAGTAIGFLLIARDTAQRAVSPIEQTNRNLQTQIASLFHPTPTVIPDPITIVHEVRGLARLETIQYTVEKVITAETGPVELKPFFGDKLILVAHGEVIAGVDLQKLSSNDVWIQNGTLSLRIPPAEVFQATLDNDKSYVYDRQTGIFTHGDVNLETTARRAAENEIRKAALADGILAQAQQNAENFLERLLRDLGYSDVVFVEATPVPPD
jgi:hypothetical protein